MHDSLAGLDLNLMVSLNAILEEKSVSKAAVKLHVSQPTVSVALRRLRMMFNDEILTRRGNSYELTPLARELSERTATALLSIRDVFTPLHPFDLLSAAREFTVQGTDHTAATIGVRACEIAQREAPGVTFRFTNAKPSPVSPELSELEICDAALLPPNIFPGAMRQDVVHDHWVCLVATDHPVVDDHITLEQMNNLPWIVTHQSKDSPRPAQMQLRMLGISPTVVAAVDSFLALPAFIVGTERIALVPSRLAEVLCRDGSLRWLPCPYDAVSLTITMYWHPKNTTDPGHAWMRGVLARAARPYSDDDSNAAAFSEENTTALAG